MSHDKLRIYQKTLGIISALFFAYFTFSVGDDAIASTYTGVGLQLKALMLIVTAAAIFGAWLFFSKKEAKPTILIGYALIFIIGLFVFFR